MKEPTERTTLRTPRNSGRPSWPFRSGGLPILRFHDVLLVATAPVHGHRLLTKRDAVFGAWAGSNWRPPKPGPSTDVVLHPLNPYILAPIARARSLLNGRTA